MYFHTESVSSPEVIDTISRLLNSLSKQIEIVGLEKLKVKQMIVYFKFDSKAKLEL